MATRTAWILANEGMTEFLHAHAVWGEDVRDALKFDEYEAAKFHADQITDRKVLVLKHVMLNS